MDYIQGYVSTNTFSVRHTKKRSIKCQIYHTPETRKVKMACDFSHLWKFILVQACIKYIYIYKNYFL